MKVGVMRDLFERLKFNAFCNPIDELNQLTAKIVDM
jgi:hypothetical protein